MSDPDTDLIRTLDRNPSFMALRRVFDGKAEEFYAALARKLYAHPERVTEQSLEGERRYWQGVRDVLNFPAAQATTRPTRGDEA